MLKLCGFTASNYHNKVKAGVIGKKHSIRGSDYLAVEGGGSFGALAHG